MAEQSKYHIKVTLEAHTDGEVDGRTIIEEFSEDLSLHIHKQLVFQEEFSKAGVEVGRRMAADGQALLAGNAPKAKAKAKSR